VADPFVAEIRMFPFNFAPRGWARCDGQLLPISQNTALFALLGTMYGGDGKSTFALPDLQGAAPMHAGAGPGLSLRDLGERTGAEAVALQPSEIPSHTHGLMASPEPAEDASGAGAALGRSVGAPLYQTDPNGLVGMADAALETAGGGQPHPNMQPYLTVQFCIALQGVFPPRS
jgi:microcystin-dependent protein